jgi:hypothetical protein
MIGSSYGKQVIRAGGFMVSRGRSLLPLDAITVLSGEVLKAGHVLGRIMIGGTAAAVAAAGNVGNGVMGAVTAGAAARPGVYRLRVVDLLAFSVEDPDGVEIVAGAVGTAFSAGGLAFTLAAGGTAFVSGDSFAITVTPGTDKYREYNPANTDGSGVPVGILWDNADATAGDVKATGVFRSCEVNAAELTWFSGATLGQQTAALYRIADRGITVSRSAL